MNRNAALGLIIAGAGFLLIHAFVYTLGSAFFKQVNVYYLTLFFLELVPTGYAELMLGIVFLDDVLSKTPIN